MTHQIAQTRQRMFLTSALLFDFVIGVPLCALFQRNTA